MKDIVIFDLDGTICNVEHRLHHINKKPKDWNAFNRECVNDTLREAEARMAYAMRKTGHTVVFLTGRDEKWREETEAWLAKHKLNFGTLLMRPTGQYESDHVVKLEVARKHLNLDEVLFVVEDRDRVVAAWRELGVTCFQCQPGKY